MPDYLKDAGNRLKSVLTLQTKNPVFQTKNPVFQTKYPVLQTAMLRLIGG